jgi:hypothetical protein
LIFIGGRQMWAPCGSEYGKTQNERSTQHIHGAFISLAERPRSLAEPAARNVMSRQTVMTARSSATLCSTTSQIVVFLRAFG